jgi:phage recombination protein Bet
VNTRQTNNRASAGAQNQSGPAGAAASKVDNPVVAANPKLMTSFAAKYGIDANKMVGILRATAFNTGKSNGQPNPPATDEEIAALVVVSNIYNLNPFLKEIYAFRNKGGGITPIVGIDGWVRIVESQPTYQGEEMKNGFDDTLGPDGKNPLGFYYECFIHRSDRKFPVSRRQYYSENYRNTEPWNMMPTRMLQHRAYIQSARAAFGLGGIYDEEEGSRIANAVDITPREGTTKPATRPPRELPPQQTGRTLEHQAPDDLLQTSLKPGETVDAETGVINPGQADAFKASTPMATEPPEFPEEEEAGSRG